MRLRQTVSWQLLALSGLLWVSGCGNSDPPPTETPGTSIPDPDKTPTPVVTPTASPSPTVGPTPTLTATPGQDLDEDGFTVEGGDCDDEDPLSYPSAPEVPYDGIDQDCDNVDLTDVDQDTWDSEVVEGEDCDDNEQATYPGAPEIADGKDNDCDGDVDEDIDSVDNDKDGYSELDGDCNDLDASIHPNAEEVPYDGIDQDCSGLDLTDVDGDGAAGGPNGADCDDAAAGTYPGATEIPYDGVDQDCSGSDQIDVDDDGYPGGTNGTDCDDNNPGRNPGTAEIPYDGIDQDCADGDLTDVDGDGQDSIAVGGTDCNDNDPKIALGTAEIPYDGIDQDCSGSDLVDVDADTYNAVQVGGQDCDDNNSNTYPGAPEFADGKDNDCDGKIDEELNTTDDDGDGFSEASGDCNDLSDTVYPGATEIPYDGIDQDCSGADLTDVDGDGFAGGTSGSDCNDNAPATYPGATEVPYDAIDQDCSGSDLTDVDRDGFDSTAVTGGTDCDDINPNNFPGATEIPYDAIDQDCSGSDLTDVDGDGASSQVVGGTDCNDSDSDISPSADEVCDSIDNNCDTIVDTDAVDRNTYYVDADQDTYGDPNAPELACEPSSRLVVDNTDCDDTKSSSNPAGTEVCDGDDNDCDSVIDEGVKTTYYQDSDGDTYGNASSTLDACTRPTGYVSNSSDCNDSVSTTYPGATETCNGADDDCDSTIDENVKTTYYQDFDGDTYGNAAVTQQACVVPTGYVTNSTDCNDTVSTTYPGAVETCNLADDDCDNTIDEDVKTTYYQDSDSDTYGNANATTQACTVPTGYVTNSTDCNDSVSTTYPGAAESCNGVDDDCDNTVDDGVKTTFYQDSDSDTYGNAAVTTQACSAPTGYVANSTDCNDSVSTTYPGATESCNGVDDDCDNTIDDGVKTTYYQDSDNDGYGNASVPTQACTVPSGYVTNSTDCNDSVSTTYPGATETCNGADDDCDNTVDEGVKNTYYQDLDGDTYGNANSTTQACSVPTGYVTNSTDCKDTNDAINPGATETCNGVDDDCDSTIDEGVKSTWYQDLDNDTYGNVAVTTQACAKPSGYVANSTDCNDTKNTVYPGAPETCNAVDDDCDGQIDDGVKTTYYADADGDTYGNANSTQQACAKPTGYVTNSTDCDDTKNTVYPGATETCNAVDDDCDGTADEGVKTTYYGDGDGDGYGVSTVTTQACAKPTGYATVTGDCDDTKAAVNPGATEVCNGIDDNCDTKTDDVDVDKDGSKPTACGGTDCNDNSSTVYVGATEVCDDTIDQNCDGRDNNCWGTAKLGTAKWHP